MKYTSKELCEDQRSADIPIGIAVFTYLSYALLYLLGHLRDFLIRLGIIVDVVLQDYRTKDFVPLLSDFESFYTRNLYRRIALCWNNPICSSAGAVITVMLRKRASIFSSIENTDKKVRAINMGSYNYLGFGEPHEECLNNCNRVLRSHGISTCSCDTDCGYTEIHAEMEQEVARFVRKEAAICFPMGFATNSGNIQALCDERCCIISDELNHASLILASRLTGSKIFVFRHNDMAHLESVVRDAIVQGRQRTHKHWDKIIVLVEGIYSMEGTFIDLPAIIKLKKKYKFYLYLDEAHSIGCTGATGRGVTEVFGIKTKHIDIMMGTFTKSFGATGGYIAADENIISYIRAKSFCSNYGVSMPPVLCAQIISTLKILSGQICGRYGQEKLNQISENVKYFRLRLKEMGFIIYGNDNSPVIPILIYVPGKLGLFTEMMLERKVAVVVVGFPATSILASRARFCISSSHTREMLDHVLGALDEVGDKINLKYLRTSAN